MLIVCLVSTLLVRRKVGSMGLRTVAVSTVHGAVVAVAAGAVGYAALYVLSLAGISSGAGIVQAVVQCVVAGSIGLAAGFAVGCVLRFDELDVVKRIADRLLKR